MKLLLTGKPGSGKTTLLESFVERVPNKQGFVTREVRENGQRVGFELVSSLGETATLASVNSDSPARVSRYGVELDQFNDFLTHLPSVQADSLLYVDEIGQMELFSEQFKQLVSSYLNTQNPYAGTISSVYRNTFTEAILGRDDIILLKVAENNRQQIREALSGLAANLTLLGRISPTVQGGVTKMARAYADAAAYLQLKKLFKNAIKYLAEDRLRATTPNGFLVEGDTQPHQVSRDDHGSWRCDCDLNNGRGKFKDNAGECSHIQAVKLKLVADNATH